MFVMPKNENPELPQTSLRKHRMEQVLGKVMTEVVVEKDKIVAWLALEHGTARRTALEYIGNLVIMERIFEIEKKGKVWLSAIAPQKEEPDEQRVFDEAFNG